MIRRLLGRVFDAYFEAIDPAYLRRHHPYYDCVNRGDEFDALYERAIALTGTPPSVWRRDRFFHLYGALSSVQGLPGGVAECGIWKGLSSYLICHRLRGLDSRFDGTGFMLIDSFEGLGATTASDRTSRVFQGKFSDTSVEAIRTLLAEYPGIDIRKGWIPQILSELPEQTYRFVHLDVDLAEPTVASFEYFYPRLVPGGLIICDDYASRTWPGTKPAVDAWLARRGARSLPLSSSDLLVFAP